MQAAERLDATFLGKLSHLRERIVTPEEPFQDAFSLDHLLSAEFFSLVDKSFERCHGKTPSIAVMSIWSKWYFTAVLPPLLGAIIWARCTPPIRLESLLYRVSEDHKVLQVGTLQTWSLDRNNPGTHFAELHGSVISPFIERYSAFSGVSKRVLWSNAGTAIDSFITYLERDGGQDQRAVLAKDLLDSRLLVDQRINKLKGSVEVKLNGDRRRKLCCLRYLVPDGKLCCLCPRLPTEPWQQ